MAVLGICLLYNIFLRPPNNLLEPPFGGNVEDIAESFCASCDFFVYCSGGYELSDIAVISTPRVSDNSASFS